MITIAVTTYNRPDYLILALNAILNQTYTDFELVILDNGSGPDTECVIQDFQRKDERIKVIKNPINNREFVNEIFHLQTREFLLWTHDDDIMKQDFLEVMLNEIIVNDLNLLSCNVELIDEYGEIIGVNKNYHHLHLKLISNDFFEEYFNYQMPILPTLIMRTSIIAHNNLNFNVNFGPAADIFFHYQCLKISPIGILNKVLFQYRIHPEQDSQKHAGIMECDLFNNLYNQNIIELEKSKKLIFRRFFSYFLGAILTKDKELREKSLRVIKNTGIFGYFNSIVFGVVFNNRFLWFLYKCKIKIIFSLKTIK